MPYSSFSLASVKDAFDLTLHESHGLFAKIPAAAPSATLTTLLNDYIPLATAISTEKARSEFLIAPILAEVRRQFRNQVSLFLGSEFTVAPEQGLQGFCDYMLCASPEQLMITRPLVTIIEAKREDIVGGLGQCIAAMVAAQQFNQRSEPAIESVYGSVTSGTNWKFLKLQGQTVYVDSLEYYINQIEQILGILMYPFQPVAVAV
ncbi:MAG: hypothetical protein WA885_13295 [Phormidesmis sp.]